MTALAQKDLFTRRYRRVARALKPSELQIQIALVQRLRLQCRPGIVYWHTPNGELRDKRHAAKLKAMGTLPGVSDLIFIFPTGLPLLFLELKAHGRGLTAEQKHFRGQVLGAGHVYEWCDNLDDALSVLREHNVLPAKR